VPAAVALPTIRARPLYHRDIARPLLTDQQRRKLAAVATHVQLAPRAIVYREGDPADSIFINGGGVVISYSETASGKRRVAGFRLYADVFGLAEHGRYVNTARAVTAVTLYRIKNETLAEVLRQDAELEFHFLCKVVDELRQAQRKAIIVARRDAAGRLAMFFDLLRRTAGVVATDEVIQIPMSRSDIGDFLNLTLESVSRASRQLSDAGILAFSGRRVRVLDRGRFDALVASG
jgi:CRP-like cAMP-binding protein